MSSVSIRRACKRKIRFMKKELVITDLMESLPRDSGVLSRVKKYLRRRWHTWLPRSMPRHVSRQGIRFVLYTTDLVSKTILTRGHWEPEQVLYFFNTARRQGMDIFLDIGANIGYYSLLATKTNDFAEIHAIEAHPENYRQLLMQIEINAFKDIIMPHNIAASEKNGELFTEKKGAGTSTVSVDKEQDVIAIKARMLDSIFNFVGRNITIKLDVEGHEVEALKRMVNLLSRNKVLLQVEILEQSMDSFYYLHDIGFRCICYIGRDFYFVNDKE